jgi:hypothetical protein
VEEGQEGGLLFVLEAIDFNILFYISERERQVVP